MSVAHDDQTSITVRSQYLPFNCLKVMLVFARVRVCISLDDVRRCVAFRMGGRDRGALKSDCTHQGRDNAV